MRKLKICFPTNFFRKMEAKTHQERAQTGFRGVFFDLLGGKNEFFSGRAKISICGKKEDAKMASTWNEGCLDMGNVQAKRLENGGKRDVERSLRRRFDADVAAKPH